MKILRPASGSKTSQSAYRRILVFVCAVSFATALFGLTGCSSGPDKADVTIINGPEPESLDPHVLTGQADGRPALALFEGLTRYNPTNGAPEPAIAKRWEISPDGLTYTFHLRESAKWSSGERITTADFLYSWQRALAPETACENAGLMYFIKNARPFNIGTIKDFKQVGVQALDEATLQVRLEGPTAFFLDLAGFVPFVVVPRDRIEKFGDRWLMAKPFRASGAYTLDYWRLNDRVRLRKNPNYWDAANTKSEVVDLLPCVSASTALNLYETGQADIVWDKELAPSDLLDVVLKRPDFHTYNYLGCYFIRFNVTGKPFDDPRVRRALALAVDKKRITERITRAGELVADSQTPPGTANGATVYQPPKGLGYDPVMARKLLADAGYPDGKGFPDFEYLFNTQKTHEKIAVELRDMWKKELGINLNLRQMEFKAYMRAQNNLQFQLVRSSWIADYNDPATFLDMFMAENRNNRTGWKNAGYDKLILEANQQVDDAKRQLLLQRAEQILVSEEAPIIPLYFYAGLEYYDSKVISGVFPNLKAEHPIRAIGRIKPGNTGPR